MTGDIIQTSDITSVAERVYGRIGRNIVHLRKTTSTMDVSRQLIESTSDVQALDGTVVVADEQIRGRGRFGRTWDSICCDNILASVILCPRLALTGQITTMGSLASAMTVDALTSARSEIKWPNDVLVHGKKVSGVIAEGVITGDAFAGVLGIGLNVNSVVATDEASAYQAISIKQVADRKKRFKRANVLTVLLGYLNELYESLDRGESIIPEWRDRLITLGSEVRAAMASENASGEVLTGIAEDVDEFGRLLIREPNGLLRAVAAGEVTLRSQNDAR